MYGGVSPRARPGGSPRARCAAPVRAPQDPARVRSSPFDPPGRQLAAAPSPAGSPRRGPPAGQGVGRTRGWSQTPRRQPATAAPPRGPLHWPRAGTPAHPMPVGLSRSPRGRLPGRWTGPVRLYTYPPGAVGRTDAVQSLPRGKSAARDGVNYGGDPCTARLPIQSGPLFYVGRPPFARTW